jgi:N6-L-threonylcarbamoyladenine synthase
MRVLGIETSCDDTAIGILTYRRGVFSIEAQVTASQVLTHRRYGGVVPEVAAREHAITILPTLKAALKKARIDWSAIDAIAVTGGPGLNTALLVGVETARTLSYLYKKPVVRVNHIEGHVVSGLLGYNTQKLRLPAVALIVSGGHTELIRVSSLGSYRLLGRTLDDAVGEAFDKTAKILGLPYPGGPEISKRAIRGRADRFVFPRAFMKRGNLDFSYSGLKTSVLYELQKHPRRTVSLVNDMAASFQVAAIEPLVTKTRWALEQTKAQTLLLGGGVAANQSLRTALTSMVAELSPTIDFLTPSLPLCMDNGVMIAAAGAVRAMNKDFTPWKKLSADPGWELVDR